MEQEGVLCVCGEGHLLDGMVQEGGGVSQCGSAASKEKGVP